MKPTTIVLLSFLLYSCSNIPTTNKDHTIPNQSTLIDTFSVENLEIIANFDSISHWFQEYNDEKVHLINFWATWCKPCVAEMPFIQSLHNHYPSDQLEIRLISLDFPNQLQSKLIPYLNQNKLKSKITVLTDSRYNQWIDKVDPNWSGSIPFTIILFKNQKKIIAQEVHSSKPLENIINQLLSQKI